MKKKIFVFTLLLMMVISITKTNATMTVSTAGEGASRGSLYLNEVYDSVDNGTNEYDPYLLQGLTVFYNIYMGDINIYNYSSVFIDAPTPLSFDASTQSYFSGTFPTFSNDSYVNIAIVAAAAAGSSGIYANLLWYP